MHAHRCAAASGRHCRRFAPVPEQPRPSPPPSRLARHHALLTVSLRTPAPAKSRRLHFLPRPLARAPRGRCAPRKSRIWPLRSAAALTGSAGSYSVRYGTSSRAGRAGGGDQERTQMATIGIVTKTAQGFRGKLQTLMMKASITIVPNEDKTAEG